MSPSTVEVTTVSSLTTGWFTVVKGLWSAWRWPDLGWGSGWGLLRSKLWSCGRSRLSAGWVWVANWGGKATKARRPHTTTTTTQSSPHLHHRHLSPPQPPHSPYDHHHNHYHTHLVKQPLSVLSPSCRTNHISTSIFHISLEHIRIVLICDHLQGNLTTQLGDLSMVHSQHWSFQHPINRWGTATH